VRLVDANVLLYAVNADSAHHEASRTWLDSALSGNDSVGLTWMVLLAFVRLSTKVGLFPSPLAVEEALAQVDEWVAAPGAPVLHPGAGHQRVLGELLKQVSTGGNLVNDAHLAAIAVEHRAGVVSYNADFSRFAGVRWERPDQLLSPGEPRRARRTKRT
jgi:toxin-antitoxin system PIN domain toxin